MIFRIPNPDSRFSTAERLVIPAPLVLRVRRPRHQLLQAAADARDQRGLLVLRRGSRGLRLLVRATGRLGLDVARAGGLRRGGLLTLGARGLLDRPSSGEHPSELQSLMRRSDAVSCLSKKQN